MENLPEKVKKCRVFIISQVRYKDIHDYLLNEDVIDIHEDQEIRHNPVERDQMSLLLTKLETKRPNVYLIFLESLRKDHDHVVEKINNTEIELPPPEQRKPLEGEIDQACMMRLSNHHLVMDKWKMVGRALGVGEADLSQITHAQRDNLKECVYEMLTTWQGQNRRCDTTKECVYQVLKDLCIRQAGDEVFYNQG